VSWSAWPVPDLDEEVRDVRGLARRYAEEQLRSVADDAERDGHFPRQVVAELAKLGLLGIGFPTELGGSGGAYPGLLCGGGRDIPDITGHCSECVHEPVDRL
jgi:alkylation response protein AidB-like acyl-CoA dehydrogenase